MTIAELIEKLRQFDQTIPITLEDGYGRYIEIEEFQICLVDDGRPYFQEVMRKATKDRIEIECSHVRIG